MAQPALFAWHRVAGFKSRGEEGLTTLEWLLVVAAVAGLAAFAVVLVQDVVDSTAESVAAHSARLEAAGLATVELTVRWRAESPKDQQQAEEISREYSLKCHKIGIIYNDVDLKLRAHPGGFDPQRAYDQARQIDHRDSRYNDLGPGWGPFRRDLPFCSY